jgi:hypothetical protein
MNAIMERWVRTCRAELLDQTLRLATSAAATTVAAAHTSDREVKNGDVFR